MTNTLNKIKKKKWLKLASGFYKNYDIDNRGRFVYNNKLVNTLDDLDYLDTDFYLNYLDEVEKQEDLRSKKYLVFLNKRKRNLNV